MPVAGYVRYKTEAEALGAIAALNESSMDGLPLRMGDGGWDMGVGREVEFPISASKILGIQEMQELLGWFEPS